MWTFENEWPAPFAGGWRQSKRVFETAHDAAVAAAEWLEICAENDAIVAVRLCRLEKMPNTATE